jgi:hypothetical protein
MAAVGIDALIGPPAPGFGSYEKFLGDVLVRLERDFCTVSQLEDSPSLAAVRRSICLSAAWCYAAAPKSIRTYVLERASTGDSASRWEVEACGRCLHEREEIASFFEAASVTMERVGGRLQWIKALALILSFRKDAPAQLGQHQACTFAKIALTTIHDELNRRKMAQLFFAALLLILGLLRYRHEDANFLMETYLVDCPQHKIPSYGRSS